MKAISLWQPYATAIAAGLKTYETRSWRTCYRGELAIHAAKKWGRDEQDVIAFLMRKHPQLIELWASAFPLGKVVCIVDLVAIHRAEEIRHCISPLERSLGDYADYRFAWEVKLIERFEEPIPASGHQGFWNWERDLA